MKQRGFWLIMLLALGGAAHGAEPPVILPTLPPPLPPPAGVHVLLAGQSYAVQANAPATVLCSPEGVCEICVRKGPVTVDGVFWPSTTSELKDFNCATLYLVRPRTAGKCELIIVSGATVIRQSLDVRMGPPPEPVPPTPTDPLTKALQEAYSSESDAGKANKLAGLAELYAAAIPTYKASGQVTTLSQLQASIHKASDLIAGSGGMPLTRKAIVSYVAGKMPAADGPITEELWQRAALYYADVAASLKKVQVK